MAKRPARKPKMDTGLIAASVTRTQALVRHTSQVSPDWGLVARAVNTVYSAANLNATVLSGQCLKLYRPAKGLKALWRGRRVNDRKQLAWLRGEMMHRPGRKAVMGASMADQVEEVTDHPVLDLLDKPDPRYNSNTQWMRLLWMWMQLTGRAYLYRGERLGAMPVSLYALEPQFTQVVGDKSNFIAEYRLSREGGTYFTMKPEDVIYLRCRVHPMDPLGAVSWVRSVVMPSDMEQAALESEIARWNNGGQPGMAIETTGATKAQVEQVRAELDAVHSGTRNAGRTLILSNAKVVQYGAKPHEMNYKDGLSMCEERIYRAAGIPDSVWQMADSNRASALAADPQYMGYVILPELNYFADVLTEELLPDFPGTEGYFFAYENPVKEDHQLTVTTAMTLADKGAITGNEARAMLGLDAGPPELDILRYMGTPLADKGVQPMMGGIGAADAEDTGDGNEGDATEPDGGSSGNPERGDSGGAADAEPGSEDQGDAGKRLGHTGRGDSPAQLKASECQCGCCAQVQTKDDRAIQTATDRFAEALDVWYQQAVRQAMQDDGRVIVPDTTELDQIIQRGLSDVFAEQAREAISSAGVNIGFDVIERAAASYATYRSANLLTGVTETLRQQVRGVIADGLAQGQSVNEIQSALRDAGIADTRSEVVARTETANARFASGWRTYSEAGWRGKRWMTAGGPCPICDAIQEQRGDVIPIDQPFVKAGESIVGTDGNVYTFDRDVLDTCAHPNCRCIPTYSEEGPEEAAP